MSPAFRSHLHSRRGLNNLRRRFFKPNAGETPFAGGNSHNKPTGADFANAIIAPREINPKLFKSTSAAPLAKKGDFLFEAGTTRSLSFARKASFGGRVLTIVQVQREVEGEVYEQEAAYDTLSGKLVGVIDLKKGELIPIEHFKD